MKDVILISGLGADKRIFDFLELRNARLTYIEWNTPQKNETLEDYARGLIVQISTKKPILIGVSFGGIIAIEISKQIEVEKIILISSVETASAIPFYLRLMGKLGIAKLLPSALLLTPNPLTFWFFGLTDKKEKDLLASILEETDPIFFKWAICKILSWTNSMKITNLYSIHGTVDRILPIRTPDFAVEEGGHLMIINRSSEINKWLETKLI